MTNAERIRSMPDRELAELIVSGEWSCICPFCRYEDTGQCKYDEEGNVVGDGETCVMGAMEWLQQQVEDAKCCSGECDFCPDADVCEKCGSV